MTDLFNNVKPTNKRFVRSYCQYGDLP